MYKDIDDAIKKERIKAEYLKEQINSPEPGIKASKCLEMAEEHEQIVEWLEELKAFRKNKTFKIGKDSHSWEVGYDKGYEQGRQDEREEWERAVADKIIKHDEDIYKALPEVIEKVRADAEKEYLLNTYGLTVKIADAEKQKIRTDAIDECIELIEHGCFISGTAGNCLRRHMEQLKEKKEWE